MSEPLLDVHTIAKGVEHMEAVGGFKPKELHLTSEIMSELLTDEAFAHTAVEINHPCAEYELFGMRLIVNNLLHDEARMI